MGAGMKPGIHEIKATEYHADPAPEPSLSNSLAKILLNKSPLHAWCAHPRLNPDYKHFDDDKFDIGTAAHAMLLEGDNTKICVVDAPDWRTKAAQTARDEARSNGLTPILAKHDTAIKRMVTAAKTFIDTTEFEGIFQNGKPEQVLLWQEDDIWLRSMLDWLTTDRTVILDYKTTEDASPEVFSRQIARMGYDMQAAFYTRGLMALGLPEPRFIFLAQETSYPHACSLHTLTPALMEIANAKVQAAVDLWTDCIASGKWPAYTSRLCWAEPAAWQIAEMERMMAEQENL